MSANSSAVALSTDDMIDAYAAEHGITYSAAIRIIDRDAIEKEYKVRLGDAIAARKMIIVDRTNMSVASRRKILARLSKDYCRIAVNFVIDPEILEERLANRAAATGKYIPADLIEQMREQYEEPTLGEFDEIIEVKF